MFRRLPSRFGRHGRIVGGLAVSLLTQPLWASIAPVLTGLTLEIPGIPGNSTRSGFENQIELTSVEFSLNRQALGDGTFGNPTTMRGTFGKRLDSASPLLALQSASGTLLPGSKLNALRTHPSSQGFTLWGKFDLSSMQIHQIGVQSTRTGHNSASAAEFILINFPNPMRVEPIEVTPPNITAPVRTFLRADNWSGTASSPQHINWINAESISANLSRPDPAAPTLSFTIKKTLDAASISAQTHFRGTNALTNVVIDTFFPINEGRQGWYHFNLSEVWVANITYAGDVATHEFNEVLEFVPRNDVTWSYSEVPKAPTNSDTTVWSHNLVTQTGTLTNFPTVTGILKSSGNVSLTWPAVKGASYTILSSPNVAGPYLLHTQVLATNTGPFSLSFTPAGDRSFFRVLLPYE